MDEQEIILEYEDDTEQVLSILEEEIVEIKPEYKQLQITPNIEEQVFKGSFDKVTVEGDSNLVPENIMYGVNIFGVEGTAEGTQNIVLEDAMPNATLAQHVTEIKQIDLNGVTSSIFFKGLNNLIQIGEIKNTSNLDRTISFFEECSKLKKVPLFDTSNCEHMSRMFYKCITITEIPQYDVSKLQQAHEMFYNCSKLKKILIDFSNSPLTTCYSMFYACNELESSPPLNTTNCVSGQKMFRGCYKMIEAPSLDTKNFTTMNEMFYQCQKLTTVPQLDAGKITNINSVFSSCSSLTMFGGFKDLGKAYTQKTTGYSNYILTLSVNNIFTHDSLMNTINNLYDLNISYNVANGGTLYSQKLILGTTNLAKLTAEEIAIATNKGWTVS